MLSLARTHKLAPRKRHVLPPGFWEKVNKEGGGDACWLWVRGKSPSGYGKFTRGGKDYRAHRVALQFSTQKSGQRRLATHGPCHNKGCVNPRHLSWQTAEGNMADKLRDGTHTRGERNGAHRLVEWQVRRIRADTRSQRQIAAVYGICKATVGHIKTRRNWAWLA